MKTLTHFSGRSTVRLIRVALIMVASTLFLGCGGSGVGTGDPPQGGQADGTRASGSVKIKIAWPQGSSNSESRVIPAATNSVRIEFFKDAALTAPPFVTRVVPKPQLGFTSTVVVDNLPVGTLYARIGAYPNPDGTGNPLAVAVQQVTIQAGGLTTTDVTLSGTVVALDPLTAPNPLPAGKTVSLQTSAHNQNGDAITLGPGDLVWTSTDTAVATVDAAGLVSGISPGTVTVTVASFANPSVKQSVSVTVLSGVTIVVNPQVAVVLQDIPLSLSADVSGSANHGVAWSVQEANGVANLTVDPADSTKATFQPSQAGTFHIVAASQADPAQQAIAAITVNARSTAAIAVSPTAVTTTLNKTVLFLALVAGVSNPDVTWSIQEGNAGGTLAPNPTNPNEATYTAPSTPGTYHVIATSVADPTKTITAVVSVKTGSAVITVN